MTVLHADSVSVLSASREDRDPALSAERASVPIFGMGSRA